MSKVKLGLQALFSEALDQESTEELEQFLDRVCAGDARLITKIEGLLNTYCEVGNFLGGSAVPTVVQAACLLPFSSDFTLLDSAGCGILPILGFHGKKSFFAALYFSGKNAEHNEGTHHE